MWVSFRKLRLKYYTRLMQNSSIIAQLWQMCVILLIILFMHILAMMHFEQLSFGDSIWLTLTSATTVGYGDLSAKTTIGRISTIILLYVGGIAVLAQVITKYFDLHQDIRKRMLKGDWSWKMENHIVFLNCPQDVNEEYFYRAISGLRQSSTDISQVPIIIVCETFTKALPERLRNLNVVHVSKPFSNRETLESANVHKAHTIVILSRNETDTVSDSINFELVYGLRDMGVKSRIVVEVINDEKRDIFKKIGANNVLRPMRNYPEHIMRAVISPGVEQVIETLFDSYEEECIRYQIEITARWGDILQRLSQNDFGVAVAYEDTTGKIVNCPPSRELVQARALFVIVHKDNIKHSKHIQTLFRGLSE